MRPAARACSATVKPLQQLRFHQTFYRTPLEHHLWYSVQSKTYTMDIPSLPTSRAFDEHRNTDMMFMLLPLSPLRACLSRSQPGRPKDCAALWRSSSQYQCMVHISCMSVGADSTNLTVCACSYALPVRGNCPWLVYGTSGRMRLRVTRCPPLAYCLEGS